MAAAAVTTASERVDDAAERRRRARALLDATTPGRSLAVGRCKVALETFRSDHGGDGSSLREARTLLGDALVCSNVHHPSIYRAWIAIELEAGTHASGVRELFEGWRIWYLRGGGAAKNSRDDNSEEEWRPSQDEGGFWCHYIDFELRHGTAATARCVGERGARRGGVPARPGCARQVRQGGAAGCPDRATAVLLSALDTFAADAGTREWLQKEVTAYSDSMRHGSWRRICGLLLSLCRRRPGYSLLAGA